MTDDDTWNVYERVWRRAEQEGAWVHYSEWSFTGEAGYFVSRFDDPHVQKPYITLIRRHHKEPPETPTRTIDPPSGVSQPDLAAELTTLAHEYGHLASFNGRTDRNVWLSYEATARKRTEITDEANDADGDPRAWLLERLDDDDRARILSEEALAWKIGRELVTSYGADADFLALYDARTRTGLHSHRFRLGIDDLWPDDETALLKPSSSPH
ncbi:MAG: hypothetical protein QM831_11940 [Kofleriaceae bacterium]